MNNLFYMLLHSTLLLFFIYARLTECLLPNISFINSDKDVWMEGDADNASERLECILSYLEGESF